MEAQATWIDGERFAVSATSGHAFVVDADSKSDTASSPMELVLIGLCSCTATDVVSILKKKREPFTQVHVSAEAERAPNPPKVYTKIRLKFRVAGNVNRKSVEDAVRLSEEKYCSVSAMLQKTAEITFDIELDSKEKATA